MPSSMHEAFIELFRHQPALVAELLADPLGLDVPPHQRARLESTDITDLVPTQYRADAVVALTTDDVPMLAVVVEVQLRRDPAKQWSWPVYVTNLRARLQCPTVLLVICADERTAAWSATTIPLGHPGLTLTPLVVGPGRVPVVTDPAVAVRSPELAVMSAMAHGNHPDRDRVWRALLAALTSVDQERSTLYSDIVLAALPAVARRELEALMATRTYEYQSDFVRRNVAQGRAESLLVVLDARGISVSEADRGRIMSSTDLKLFDAWLRRAVTATTIEDLFES